MAARDLVEQQRAEQLLRDAKLAAELARQYGPAWERMRTEILQILAVVEKARLAGETVDTRWLLRKGYLDRLEKLVTFQTRTFLDFTARKVQDASVQAALDGQRDAAELVAEAAPGDVPKPLLETSYAVNNLAAGKPLRHLLDTLPGQVGSQAAGALLEGVVLGLGPREIARDIRKVATIPLTRALLISRTETLRVYRQAAFDRYRQSADVLTGWVWLAKLDDRTCPVCIALHGTRHELSEEMASHPNCRCSPAPLTEPWTDPDLPDTRFAPQTGEAWFKGLSPDRQRAILGPGKFALYEQGELTLADLVQPTEHVVWGKGVREKALKEIATPTRVLAPVAAGDIQLSIDPMAEWKTVYGKEPARAWIGPNGEEADTRWADAPFSADQMDALAEYQGGGYHSINYYLRDRKSWRNDPAEILEAQDDERRTEASIKSYIKNIDQTMRPAPMEYISYRSISPEWADEVWGDLTGKKGPPWAGSWDSGTQSDWRQLVGTEIRDNGYSSTTMDDPSLASRTANVLNQIVVPAGTPSAYLPAVMETNFSHEQELLLARGMRFRLVDVGTAEELDGTDRVLLTWEAMHK